MKSQSNGAYYANNPLGDHGVLVKIQIKNSATFFYRNKKKSHHLHDHKRPWKANPRKNKEDNFIPHDFELHYKTIVIKTVWNLKGTNGTKLQPVHK